MRRRVWALPLHLRPLAEVWAGPFEEHPSAAVHIMSIACSNLLLMPARYPAEL
jgi:hypothetical protein